MFSKTRIIATVGPATTKSFSNWAEFNDLKNQNEAQQVNSHIKNLILNGVNIFRMNLSHGEQEIHIFRSQLIKEIAHDLKIKVEILFDTKGPEIRVCQMSEDNFIAKDSEVIIHCQKQIIGKRNEFSVIDASKKYNMINDVKANDRILVDDGKLILVVKKIDSSKNIIYTIAKNNHVLKTNKRLNLPDSNYSLPFLSKKDIDDINLAANLKIPYLALSFVSNVKQINEVKALLKDQSFTPKLIAKIETQEAIDNLEEIIKNTNGVMVARGDLGLEVPFYKIPIYQNKIVELCHKYNKYCIIATQMLDSLERNLLPTRAEVTDVYYAVNQKVNATMLSGETAAGIDPINAVSVMQSIILETENNDIKQEIEFASVKLLIPNEIKSKILDFHNLKTNLHKLLVVNLVDKNYEQTIYDLLKCNFNFSILFVVNEDRNHDLLLKNTNFIVSQNKISNQKELLEFLDFDFKKYELLFVFI
ncbi:pyruvate kinase [Ureaplasma urealyticum]|uniref:Pyruvate kinase n=3 Tax=Ureaplasma urealyticum TaxID=2130 RepID=A0AAP9D790_UREUR|nr:pyruvate kinase [Ureaplasma urealyticum]EDX53808.1 pyruvate kinase [Ureaplasma urealyticum serovar 9 str. ATCC 33175]ACI59836.1 pyruvate kinase [Ureaplasma urealyticum serovar 10 str. ATCC 33699]EDT49603.1 pyruvate kinase [Ureaplasma urealyticum serovar 13 str. ATCC 33698]EDU06393.1 pyruvate kinase [Ureaplasma urealyticum serovar 5 str. ATCC 27817]EDU57038.1 pyruvate kinase [Ureaplasma urealyticum serovar 7 str. ATCC 27819]